MRPIPGIARWGIAVLAVGAASCASAPNEAASRPAASPAAPTVDQRTIDAASLEFALGREAALAGDFLCARYRFGLAIDAVRSAGGAPALRRACRPSRSSCTRASSATRRSPARPRKREPRAARSTRRSRPRSKRPRSREAIATAREAVASDQPAAAPDVPIIVNDSVLRVVAAFQSNALHGKISAGLVRSGRYLPMIHRVFAEEGLPQDLAMIAFIESAFLPLARSKASAHGIWQFMPRTGRQYGLRSNGVVDERRDPEKATRAAAQYLAYLYEIFGDWYLAMAAYNAGEGKILRAMNRTGARDFWALASTNAIRKQTKNYVPAFLASVLISKNPAHYGFVVVPDPASRVRHRSARPLDQPRRSGEGLGVPPRGLPDAQPRAAVLRDSAAARGLRAEGPDRSAARRSRSPSAAVPTTRPPEFRDARREEGRHAAQDRPHVRRLRVVAGFGQFAFDPLARGARPGRHGAREGQEDRKERQDGHGGREARNRRRPGRLPPPRPPPQPRRAIA